jgi:hypothetical protein
MTTESPVRENSTTQTIADIQKSAKQKTEDLAREFVMPPVDPGDEVLWFPIADRNKPPHIAVVRANYHQQIEVTTRGPVGQEYDSVRHVDDPKLILNPNYRKFGAWDYTDGAKAKMKKEKDLDDRIARLEKAVEELSSSRKQQSRAARPQQPRQNQDGK